MKIALIDDHQILSDALKVNLMHSLPEIESIHHFNSFEPYAAVADDSIPTIVITELAFNGRYDKGVDAIFRLNLKNTQIIVLTSLTDDWLIRSYMRLGARAFLTKTCQYKELLEAITQVRKGNLFLSEHVQNILLTRIETGGISAESLSSVERAIMEALSQEEPLKSTAQKLKISLIELKYHRKMLMTRFNVRNFADLVELARRPGFFTESAAERSAVEHSV
ncbi:response regulator [Dyadobacter fermentans]|uniref:Two component transcriptional regulator, LuxR family n=1 Tax=Dyadobacter fermentans (strain ATCC 700827 / DSM 18053 / CIP 107007 / KCTC 52180 / NS114) TaxID=471854 RepID=C6VVP2_DYAFD|nr:response regulator transcription factor [Dyadobacter fermentans]ACT91348.1 two component transcriptional regulator, LuxR family [Dyadobacter fermentans DSM 18053]